MRRKRETAVGFLLNLHKDETMVQLFFLPEVREFCKDFARPGLHNSFARLRTRCYILQQRCNVLHNSFGLRNNTDTNSDTHLDT